MSAARLAFMPGRRYLSRLQKSGVDRAAFGASRVPRSSSQNAESSGILSPVSETASYFAASKSEEVRSDVAMPRGHTGKGATSRAPAPANGADLSAIGRCVPAQRELATKRGIAAGLGPRDRSQCMWVALSPADAGARDRKRTPPGATGGVRLWRRRDRHSVESRLDAGRQLGSQLLVIEVDMHVGEDRALRADAVDPLQRQVEVKMARMRAVP